MAYARKQRQKKHFSWDNTAVGGGKLKTCATTHTPTHKTTMDEDNDHPLPWQMKAAISVKLFKIYTFDMMTQLLCSVCHN